MKPTQNHYLIFDPTAFLGGSKIATREALSLTSESKTKYTIVTAHQGSWDNSFFAEHHDVAFVQLPELKPLSKIECGKLYWLKQCIYMLFLLATMLRITKVNALVGTSGPGVDMSLYLVKKITQIAVMQFIHGPVAKSRSIGYCLTIADSVFYLTSTKSSIHKAINHFQKSKMSNVEAYHATNLIIQSGQYESFENGIAQHNWPSRVQYDFPTVFWCASLLKWKRLDLFIDASRSIEDLCPIAANVCFIRPVDSSLSVCKAPVSMAHFRWYQEPSHLDEIRSRSNIFVSTSQNEPFGLSILEAMAAGMCIIIPRDGAYWDTVLTHNVNCIKYAADDAGSLADALVYANSDRTLVEQLGAGAYQISLSYQAENSYRSIINGFNHPRLSDRPSTHDHEHALD
ncbi:glycosyltransferase family 4 protein [Vibrio amylolyticus]|uniref:glycosyltransferase family 4 protein n=1 Tax=Vibrio amylolyticus TaxID=2847292 RepID=UPI00354CF9E3